MRPEFTVVCWKWRPTLGYTHGYTAGYVNIAYRSVKRLFDVPHRFVCLTDEPAGIMCETHPVPTAHATVPNPTGGGRPSCYRRLWIFSNEASRLFGPRILSIDLDMVFVGDLRPLWLRPEPFVGLIDPYVAASKPGALNGSMFLFDSEDPENRAIWEGFDPVASPKEAHEAGERGSDQGYLSMLKRGCASWTSADGVYRYTREIRPARALPDDARIVNFPGSRKPWHVAEQTRCGWIKQHWRL